MRVLWPVALVLLALGAYLIVQSTSPLVRLSWPDDPVSIGACATIGLTS